jgi:sugar/nucleoside kinase (ribokinase family)
MIAVAGDIMVDLFLLSQLREAEQGSGVLMRGGGSAANTAAWLAHFGVPVCFAGCVGADPIGDMLIREIEATGVRSRIRAVSGEETGAVAVEVGESGERVMRSSRGANQLLSPDDILGLIVEQPHIVHLTGYSLLGPYGLSLLEAAHDMAERTGSRISFDPSSVGVINRIGVDVLASALVSAAVNVLLPNESEALALIPGTGDIWSALPRLGSLAPVVVLKMGGAGAAVVEGGRERVIKTTHVPPLDTTGAGDAFNAAVLAGIFQGQNLEVAIQTGHDIAGEVVRRYGGRP